MTFPSRLHDPELGDIEWVFPTTTEEEVKRINKDVQKKIDIIEGKTETTEELPKKQKVDNDLELIESILND